MPTKHLVVAITGTPGAGKSSFAKLLSDSLENSKILELNDIVEQYKLYSRIDEMGSKIVKLEMLEKKANEVIKEMLKDYHVIVVGHLVPEMEMKPDMIIVIRVGLKELVKRLEERKYQIGKIRENIVSESIDYCGLKSLEACKETYEIETEEEKKGAIDYIRCRASGKPCNAPKIQEISKFNELLELVAMEGNKYGL